MGIWQQISGRDIRNYSGPGLTQGVVARQADAGPQS